MWTGRRRPETTRTAMSRPSAIPPRPPTPAPPPANMPPATPSRWTTKAKSARRAVIWLLPGLRAGAAGRLLPGRPGGDDPLDRRRGRGADLGEYPDHRPPGGQVRQPEQDIPLRGRLRRVCRRGLAELADRNCALFLWITLPKLCEAWCVMEAWGFEYAR